VVPDLRNWNRVILNQCKILITQNIVRKRSKIGHKRSDNFWTAGQRAFFDVRVFNLFSQRYSKTKVENCFCSMRRGRTVSAIEFCRVKTEHLRHLVFAENGAMGRECVKFYKRLAEMISEKRKDHTSKITNSIRTMISFSLLRSTVRCIRGSRGRARLLVFTCREYLRSFIIVFMHVRLEKM